MNYYSYKIEHDYGLAPNPFHGYCTLAVCKSRIRNNSNLQIGDWVIGTGSVALGNENHVILAMRVDEKITFDKYWNDSRFYAKRPVLNGSLVQLYGDNFYHTDLNTGEVIQENSAHSIDNTTSNETHKKRDSSGKYVLVSTYFYYFGKEAPMIPDELMDICDGRNFKYVPENIALTFINWLNSNYTTGIHGDPCSWKKHLNNL